MEPLLLHSAHSQNDSQWAEHTRDGGSKLEYKECWPRILPPFLHLENEGVSLIVHWQPSTPKHTKSLRKLLEAFLILIRLLQLSFHLLWYLSPGKKPYLIQLKLRDHVETPVNVLVFIYTSWMKENTTNLRKFIFLLMVGSCLNSYSWRRKTSSQARFNVFTGLSQLESERIKYISGSFSFLL